MAKVSPLLGRTKFDWGIRLGALVYEIGNWALNMGDEGTKRSSGSIMRNGYRFVYTSKKFGRHRTQATCISIYGRGKAYIFGSRNYSLDGVNCITSGVEVTDYKEMYKFLERRVYATFNAKIASEIMSEADSLYDVLTSR
ncbi:hypothetical protein ST201phi2-1p290 [Pseudomonas phage 201phi2-1]|uniref:Uncharacterized protein n=1 Tax=Pseudomonas phage 201phi2-1 TaxID=198110 RepID=B3FJF0_BP201|nr:hypothetical protein ST201phi2-1p290 [Pseudomonas phage 201phi2-1]ABY63116.1 hypothetical protein 201phi2-1p290 [Pseudomonas phage 201phi2-1]